jgi:hypothetical protein
VAAANMLDFLDGKSVPEAYKPVTLRRFADRTTRKADTTKLCAR